MKTVHLENKKSRLFVNLFTGIPDIPTKLNSRRIGYPGKQKGESRNMERNPRVFSRIPAPRFRDARLHRRKNRLHRPRMPTSPYTKTVVMATKTVFAGKNCAPHGNSLFLTTCITENSPLQTVYFNSDFAISDRF